MREILTEINELQIQERGCMPNLRDASSVGHDGEGGSYAARTISRGRLNPAMWWKRRSPWHSWA